MFKFELKNDYSPARNAVIESEADKTKKLEDAEKAKKLEKESKEELTDEQIIEKAGERVKEINAIPEADRTDEDKKILETFSEYEKAESPEDSTGFKDLMTELDSDSILDIEDGKEYADSKEGFIELIEDNRDGAVKQFRETLPNEVEQMLKFVVDGGGTMEEYKKTLTQVDYSSVSLESEYNQKLMVATIMTQQGYNDAAIQKRIAMYEEKEALQEEAKGAQVQLANQSKKAAKELIDSQAVIAKDRLDKKETKRLEFVDLVDNLTEIDKIPVSKKDAKALKSYMTRTVRGGKTQWQLDSVKVDSQVKAAFFSMKKFNLDKISAGQKTNYVKEIRSILNKTKDTNLKKPDSGLKPEERNKDKQGLVIPGGTGTPWS